MKCVEVWKIYIYLLRGVVLQLDDDEGDANDGGPEDDQQLYRPSKFMPKYYGQYINISYVELNSSKLAIIDVFTSSSHNPMQARVASTGWTDASAMFSDISIH